VTRRFQRDTDEGPKPRGTADVRTLALLHRAEDERLAAEDARWDELEQELAQRRRRQELAERTLRTVTLDLLERSRAAETARDAAMAERDQLRRHVATQAILVDPPPPPGGLRRGLDDRSLRIVLVLAFIVGSLVVVDAFLTIVWQEPLTGFFAQQQQDALSRELAATASAFALPGIRSGVASREPRAVRVRRAATRLLGGVRPGHAVGSLRIPKLGLKTAFVEGTASSSLRRAPGHYRSTMLPGLPGTVGIAGHRTTFGAPFRHLDRLRAGDRIELRMPYGTFTYRVRRTRIVQPSDVWPLTRRAGPGRLVLTACHPVGSAAQRILVTAERA